jgi:hypothetical protein
MQVGFKVITSLGWRWYKRQQVLRQFWIALDPDASDDAAW